MASRIPHSAWHNPSSKSTATRTGSALVKSDRELAGNSPSPESLARVDVPRTTESGREISVALPESYEPNYAYPLIVWLHGDGGSETEVQALLPTISERNYIGLAIRGYEASSLDRAWSIDADQVFEFTQELRDTVCRLRRCYHIHSERIIIAGFESGASMALRILLAQPEWFGGAVLLGGGCTESNSALRNIKQLRNKPVFFGAGSQDLDVDAERLASTARLLHCAGMNVKACAFDAEHEITVEMLRNVDQWIMDDVCNSKPRD